MRRLFYLCLALVLVLSGCAVGAGAEEEKRLSWPEEPLTLFVSSDLHWQTADKREGNTLIRQMAYLDEIVDTLLSEAVAAKPAALLLCGDLTNSGSVAEHRELVAKLERARQQGLAVYVTMGNHDMDRGAEPAVLEALYADFGYGNARSADEDSMSYLAAVSDELWLLSLDTNLYGERTGTRAGLISEKTLAWVENCLQQAAEQGAMVIPFSHHNLVVHNMNGKGDNYNIDGGDALAALMLDYGVPIYLSGHRHNSFVATAEQGSRRLDELVSDMPAAYPHRYTTVTLRGDGFVDYAVPNLDVSAWARGAGRTEPTLLDFKAYTEALAAPKRREAGAGNLARLALPDDIRADMIDYYADFQESYQNRRLHAERERLLTAPGYGLWQKYAGETVYGRWMPWLLQNQYGDASEQVLGPYR